MTEHRLEPAERLVFFSDAVFAIAMTLLVLDLKVPTLPEPVTTAAVNHALVEKVPAFVAFVLSFAVLGTMWVTHHVRFNTIARVDARLVQLDLLLLFLVALVPMPTGLLFGPTAESPWPVVLYAANLGLAYLVLNLLWRHAFRTGLTTVDAARYRQSQWATTPVWVVFLASIPLAFPLPRLAPLAWCLIALVQPFVHRWARRRAGAAPGA